MVTGVQINTDTNVIPHFGGSCRVPCLLRHFLKNISLLMQILVTNLSVGRNTFSFVPNAQITCQPATLAGSLPLKHTNHWQPICFLGNIFASMRFILSLIV